MWTICPGKKVHTCTVKNIVRHDVPKWNNTWTRTDQIKDKEREKHRRWKVNEQNAKFHCAIHNSRNIHHYTQIWNMWQMMMYLPMWWEYISHVWAIKRGKYKVGESRRMYTRISICVNKNGFYLSPSFYTNIYSRNGCEIKAPTYEYNTWAAYIKAPKHTAGVIINILESGGWLLLRLLL